jgi:putative oxidoreductase
MKNFVNWLSAHGDWAIEIVRAYLGVLLIWRGLYFLQNSNEFLQLIGAERIPMAAFFFAHYVMFAHIVGGALLAVGLLTRVVAAFQLPILCGAVVVLFLRGAHSAPGSEFEYALLVLGLLAMYVFYGSGRLSVDHVIDVQAAAQSKRPV